MSVAQISPAWNARLLLVSSQASPPGSHASFQNAYMNATEAMAGLPYSSTFFPVRSVSAPPKDQSSG